MRRTALGFPHRVPYWMGQAISESDKDRLMVVLGPAEDTYAAVQAWTAGHSNWDAAFGPRAADFGAMKSEMDSISPDVDAVYAALRSSNPDDWTVTDDQRAEISRYVSNANILWSYIQGANAAAEQSQAPAAAAGTAPAPVPAPPPGAGPVPAGAAPAPSWTGLLPAAATVLAPRIPGAKPKPPAPAPAPAPRTPARPSGGISTPVLVVGGTLLVGGLVGLFAWLKSS